MRRRTLFMGIASTIPLAGLSVAVAEPQNSLAKLVVGRWKGLRTPFFGAHSVFEPGQAAAQDEVLVFYAGGTYVSERPASYKGKYRIQGDKVIIEGGREFRYKNGSLIGFQTVLSKVRP